MAVLRSVKSNHELKIQERWFDVRRLGKSTFDDRPDINAILFLIGIK